MAAPGVMRVVEREARVFRHLWYGSIFSALVAPVLYLTAIGVLLGDLVDRQTGVVEGLDYLTFVSAGLMTASAMQTAAPGALWPVMAGFKWLGFYHGMAATPIEPRHVIGGLVVWNFLRTAVWSVPFLVFAAALGGVESWWAPLSVPVAALTGAAFSAPLAAFVATQETDQTFPLIMRLGVLPLFLFSGTFFPIDILPGWLQGLAVASPLWHGVEVVRGATTGTLAPWPDVGHLAVLLAVVAAGWAIGTRTFARRLAP